MKFQLHQAVKRLTKSSQRVTAKKIQEILPENIGLRTLQRRLKEDQCIKFRNIPKTIKLNKDQQNKRVEIIKGWFKQRLNFQNVIFTDEARFSVDGPDRFMSWQLKDKISDFNRMKRPFDGGGLMVHGVLGTDGSLMVTRVNGTVDSCKYIALLEHTILPYIVNKFGNKSIMQQDNAPPHVSKLTATFFKNKIKTLKWPPHSPDLSPIENVWKMLKGVTYTSNSFKNLEELWENVQKGVEYLNAHKRNEIKRMLANIPDKYLDVLTKGGKV